MIYAKVKTLDARGEIIDEYITDEIHSWMLELGPFGRKFTPFWDYYLFKKNTYQIVCPD